jgi:hypothetical protein
MDHALTRMTGETTEPAPLLSVGGLLIEALARQDFAALAGCLDPGVRMRALLPRGPVEMAGPAEVTGWFRSLFGGPDDFELADGTVGEIGPRLVCPICADAKQIDKGNLLPNAELGGTVVMWDWIGDEPATTFSY